MTTDFSLLISLQWLKCVRPFHRIRPQCAVVAHIASDIKTQSSESVAPTKRSSMKDDANPNYFRVDAIRINSLIHQTVRQRTSDQAEPNRMNATIASSNYLRLI